MTGEITPKPDTQSKMSSSDTTTIPVADCEVVDIPSIEAKPEVTELCMFQAAEPIAVKLARTAEYAKDPKGYLARTVGDSVSVADGTRCIPTEPLVDDMYGMSTSKAEFETHIAKLLGKTTGLFFPTGVQAQLAAVKIYCQRANKNTAAWHISCHLETAEQAAYKELYGLDRILLGTVADKLATVEQIKTVLDRPEAERPAVIVVEIPNRVLGCETYTFSELEELSAACKTANVAFHMDGARLWEIEPWYQAKFGKSFADVAGLFDSVYVSMYKGLGGATGAFLNSNDASFIDEAKIWQRRAGGTAFSSSYYWIDCQRGFNESIGTFARKREKMLEVAKGILEATKQYTAEDGQPIVSFRPSLPNCCQTHTIFHGFTDAEFVAARDRVLEKTHVKVFGALRPKITGERLAKRYEVITAPKYNMYSKSGGATAEDLTHFMEWMIMSVTEKIDTQVFVDGYVKLCKELLAGK